MSRLIYEFPQKFFDLHLKILKGGIIFDNGVIMITLHRIVGTVTNRYIADADSPYQQSMAVGTDSILETLNLLGFANMNKHQLFLPRKELSYLLHAISER